MGNSCSSVKLYLEKKVAGSITKRTLAKDAKHAPAGAARDALATTSPDYFAYDWNLNTQ